MRGVLATPPAAAAHPAAGPRTTPSPGPAAPGVPVDYGRSDTGARDVTRPRLLDLFCGAGGGAMGYYRAGFEVVGIDIEPQPCYPFKFYEADALEFLALLIGGVVGDFDVIHASPPCEFATTMNVRWRKRGGTVADRHVNLLTPTAAALRQLGMPYVVENVVGTGQYFRPTLLLHGGMFGLGVHRPRLFESSELILASKTAAAAKPVGVYGDHPQHHYSTRQNGDMKGRRSEFRRARSIDEARELMGMPWADWDGCRKAIPPAYTEHIGRQIIAALMPYPQPQGKAV